MKIFVTGASGFLGSHFVRHAIAEGHEVRATHRQSSTGYQMAGLKWLRAELDTLPPEAMGGCSALVHFAAAGVSPKPATRNELTYWNVSVPQKLMECAKEAGVRRIVLAGSYAEYGRSADAFELIPPDAPLLPTSGYAASKAACFASCHAAALELGLELCYLRVFSAYGEGQSVANFWPSLRAAALDGRDFPMTYGEQLRDFVAVEDVAKEFLHAATRSDVAVGVPRVWNVGSGQPITLKDFALQWWRAWQATGSLQFGTLPYRPNEVMKFVPLITDRAPRTAADKP